jgi:small GTP-binding protein
MRGFVRVAVAGSVDDGKSTLLGRLLNDTGRVFSDEAEAVKRASGSADVNLAFFTDGLVSERARGITMDVAWRHFVPPGSSGKRLLLADVPGHTELIRNMATGASVADVAVLLVDAMRGVQPQTRRHLVMLSGLRVKRVALCLNKMDGVNFAEAVFSELTHALTEFTKELELDVDFIPVSALSGDNVVHRSAHMPWYSGPTVAERLSAFEPKHEEGGVIAHVQLSTGDDGWTSLHLEQGDVRANDVLRCTSSDVTILEVSPLGAGRVRTSRALRRGELLTNFDVPVSDVMRARVTWIGATETQVGDSFTVLQQGRATPALLEVLEARRSVSTGRLERATSLGPGDVGVARLRLARPTWILGPALLVDGAGRTVAGVLPE